jgi:hypothetical protein
MEIKKPFKITQVNLSDLTKDDPETRDRLTNAKVEIDCLGVEATKLVREARVASAKAAMAMARRDMAVQAFLVMAGDVSDQIAREETAMPPYTNGRGEICVDIPFTQRDQRLAVRAAHKQLAQQAGQGDDADPDMFEGGEGEQG